MTFNARATFFPWWAPCLCSVCLVVVSAVDISQLRVFPTSLLLVNLLYFLCLDGF